MDGLAFRYKEMYIMESSTDSDSEISRRWSDTSTMGCMSSTPERATIPHLTLPLSHKPGGKNGCYSLFLDPYDGSSEESDESKIEVSSKVTRRHRQPGGGGGGGGRSRRSILHHPTSVVKKYTGDKVTKEEHVVDVQMKCGSDSELTCGGFEGEVSQDSGKYTQSMDLELKDSDLHVSGSSSHGPVPLVEVGLLLHSSSENPHCPFQSRSLHKRKLDFPGLDGLELEQRKKQCLVNM